MQRPLTEYLELQGISNSEFARRIGLTSQTTGVWKRHEDKVCLVDWDMKTGVINKVTLEKFETVYNKDAA